MRNTSGHYDTLLTTIEGRLEGKRERGRPRRTWVDDIREWTGSKSYDQIKRAAENRNLHGTFATHSSGCNIECYNEQKDGLGVYTLMIMLCMSKRTCIA